jgi:hypothetical protein
VVKNLLTLVKDTFQAAIKSLSPAEYAATTKAKRAGKKPENNS